MLSLIYLYNIDNILYNLTFDKNSTKKNDLLNKFKRPSHQKQFKTKFRYFYKGFLPWMTLNITAIIANTNNKWTNPLVINPPKNPIAQMIIKITAIVYNIFPIAYLFLLNQISYKKNTIGL